MVGGHLTAQAIPLISTRITVLTRGETIILSAVTVTPIMAPRALAVADLLVRDQLLAGLFQVEAPGPVSIRRLAEWVSPV